MEHFYSNRGVWIKVDDWLGIKVVISLTVVVHLIFKDLKLQFKLDFFGNVKYMFLKQYMLYSTMFSLTVGNGGHKNSFYIPKS